MSTEQEPSPTPTPLNDQPQTTPPQLKKQRFSFVDEYCYQKGRMIIARDWQTLTETTLSKAAQEDHLVLYQVEDAIAAGNLPLLDLKKAELARLKGNPKEQEHDHLQELIWVKFRGFVKQCLNRTLPPLYKQAPEANDIGLFFRYDFFIYQRYTFRKAPATVVLKPGGVATNVQCLGLKSITLQKYRQAFEYAFSKGGYNNLFLGENQNQGILIIQHSVNRNV